MKAKPNRVPSTNKTKTVKKDGKTIYQPKLENAQKIARENPRTFDVPTQAELILVQKGHVVKICDGLERFWVLVKICSKNYLIGRIDNHLMSGQDYTIRDLILFKRENIYDIHSEEMEELGDAYEEEEE